MHFLPAFMRSQFWLYVFGYLFVLLIASFFLPFDWDLIGWLMIASCISLVLFSMMSFFTCIGYSLIFYILVNLLKSDHQTLFGRGILCFIVVGISLIPLWLNGLDFFVYLVILYYFHLIAGWMLFTIQYGILKEAQMNSDVQERMEGVEDHQLR